MVGAAICCALADSDLTIRLLEAKLPAYTVGKEYDLRVSAISRSSQKLLKRLGVWDFIASTRICPYRRMHVWEEASDAAVHFDSAELQEPALGHIIENELIRQALFRKISTYENVSILNDVDIAWTDFSPSTASIGTRSGKVLKSRLVIGADGAASKVRDWAGIGVNENDTGHYALVASVAITGSHQQTAWQKFLNTGPLAFLPLADGKCSIVWSTGQKQALKLAAMDSSSFLEQINQKIVDAPFAPVVSVSKRLTFPLIQRHATAYHRHNVVLIGDAAHTIHPLAGQGINLGLADVKELAKILLANKRAIGSEYILAEYERTRRTKNWLMLQSMRVFKEVFSLSNRGVGIMRSLGMKIFNGSDLAKKVIMQKAMDG